MFGSNEHTVCIDVNANKRIQVLSPQITNLLGLWFDCFFTLLLKLAGNDFHMNAERFARKSVIKCDSSVGTRLIAGGNTCCAQIRLLQTHPFWICLFFFFFCAFSNDKMSFIISLLFSLALLLAFYHTFFFEQNFEGLLASNFHFLCSTLALSLHREDYVKFAAWLA